MSPCVQVILSGTLSFGAPLLIGIHELILLRRGKRPGRGPDAPEEPRPPRPGPPRANVQKPLPACLVPALPPRQVRAVERPLEPVG